MGELRIAYVGAPRHEWAWRFERRAPLELQEGLETVIRLGQDDGGGWRQCGRMNVRIERRAATNDRPDHAQNHPGMPRCVCPACCDQWVGVEIISQETAPICPECEAAPLPFASECCAGCAARRQAAWGK